MVIVSGFCVDRGGDGGNFTGRGGNFGGGNFGRGKMSCETAHPIPSSAHIVQ